jgi:hypothetical protein
VEQPEAIAQDDVDTVPDAPTEAASEPEPEPTPIPVSEADNSAEVISEPWRLAAERPPDDHPEPDAAVLQSDLPADADETVAMAREDVEAALRGPDDDPPRFSLGEPGTGVEDMKIDMCPDAPRAFELDAPGEVDSPGISTEAPDLDRTARVPREEIESALREPAAAAPAFEPPLGLEEAIASFNARHVVLFRALRAEIGAGAANFVRSCRVALDGGHAELFATAELRADGSWDPDGLRRSVIERRAANAEEGFRRLLDGELERLRAPLGDERAAVLAGQLASIS